MGLFTQQINKVRCTDKGRQQASRHLIRKQDHASCPIGQQHQYAANQCGTAKLSGPTVKVAIAVSTDANSKISKRTGVTATPNA